MNCELGWTPLPNKLEGMIVSLNHLLFTRDDAILVTTTGNGDNLNHVSMKVPQHDMFTLQNKQILTFKLFLITSLHQLHLQFIVDFV